MDWSVLQAAVFSGEIDFNSPDNVAKRKALRHEPIVEEALLVWWTTASNSLLREGKVTDVADARVDHDEYVTVGMKMCAVSHFAPWPTCCAHVTSAVAPLGTRR